jgi:broad specificity phosphatase PhoE
MLTTRVQLVRHGEVDNPEGILYGRLPGYGLSPQGRLMAERLGEYFADAPIDALVCSPLQRTRETMAPIAGNHPELDIRIDERVIETENAFQGTIVKKALLQPRRWKLLLRPWRPSWGESYASIAERMQRAVVAAAEANPGGTTVIVTHQLPIWVTRLAAEGRSFVHDPRKRQCSLASVTTLELQGSRVVRAAYDEPARDLLRAGVPHA